MNIQMNIDYKERKKSAKRTNSENRSVSQAPVANYYQSGTKKLKKKGVTNSDKNISSDDETWVKGKIQNANLFSDSDNRSIDSESEIQEQQNNTLAVPQGE